MDIMSSRLTLNVIPEIWLLLSTSNKHTSPVTQFFFIFSWLSWLSWIFILVSAILLFIIQINVNTTEQNSFTILICKNSLKKTWNRKEIINIHHQQNHVILFSFITRVRSLYKSRKKCSHDFVVPDMYNVFVSGSML